MTTAIQTETRLTQCYSSRSSREQSVRDGHARGWSFTPLAAKRPVLKGWPQRARETVDEALEWARRGNVGLRTGAVSGVVVIDADAGCDLSGLELPTTVTVRTGNDGLHLYYRCSTAVGNSAGKLGPHIDVRGDGGQVVFPGSTHPQTHRQYEWDAGLAPWQTDLADLPEHIIEMLAEPAPPMPPKHGGAGESVAPSPSASLAADRYAAVALQGELAALRQAAEGTRNDSLNRAAFNLGTLVGGGLLDRGDVERSLVDAALAIGLGPDEAHSTIRSGLDSGVKHPRKVESPQTGRASTRARELSDTHGVPSPDQSPRAQVPALQEAAAAIQRDHPSHTDSSKKLPAGRFALDLYGNADRFMHLFGLDVHWCEDRGKWLVWDGRCWQADAARQVARLAERTMRAMLVEAGDHEETVRWAVRCNKDAKAGREMLEVVKHRSAIAAADLDRDAWLLGADNGVIDLRTGVLRPHRREDLISILSPSRYEIDAPCPRWERFLHEIMGGDEEMVAALQRLAGHFLTGDISVQILPILYGPGGNGKNVFLDTLMGILGRYAEEAPDGLITSRCNDEHPTEIADLCGKRLVVASETEEGRKLRIGLVKKITGNKFLKGRFMRQDYFQFERTHKTVLVTNNRPVVTETGNAIWRRLRLIPFVVTIPEIRQDRRLTERLTAEWPGILAWAVRGCLDWQARRCDLQFPQAVQDATDEYRNDSDHVADFLAECCVDWRRNPEQNMRTPKERVYAAYGAWCRNVGEDCLTRNTFNGRMRSQGFEERSLRINGRAQRCWLNVTLKGGSDA